jgi:Holliday junction resolvase RusA-like endonuclease
VERETSFRGRSSRYHAYFGTKRRADIDNFNKLSLDALTGIAYDDDSQVAELHLYRAYDKNRPRIEVQIVKVYPETCAQPARAHAA